MKLNSWQKAAMVVGSVLLLLTFLFPHYHTIQQGFVAQEKYDFIFYLHKEFRNYKMAVDYKRMLMQMLVITLITGAAVLVLNED